MKKGQRNWNVTMSISNLTTQAMLMHAWLIQADSTSIKYRQGSTLVKHSFQGYMYQPNSYKILAKTLTQWPMCQFFVVIEIEKLKKWKIHFFSIFMIFKFSISITTKKLTHWPLCQFFCQNLKDALNDISVVDLFLNSGVL